MIKAKGTKKGKEILLLGLSDMNVKKLQQGLPIVIERAEIDLPFDIIIFYGKTEEDMIEILADAGMLDVASLQIREGGE